MPKRILFDGKYYIPRTVKRLKRIKAYHEKIAGSKPTVAFTVLRRTVKDDPSKLAKKMKHKDIANFKQSSVVVKPFGSNHITRSSGEVFGLVNNTYPLSRIKK